MLRLDTLYETMVESLHLAFEALAGESGQLHDFRYINYASAYQDVFGILRRVGALDGLRDLREQYDPDGFLTGYLRRPFDLPVIY